VLSLHIPHFRYYYNTDLAKSHKITQAEVYTSLSLVDFHILQTLSISADRCLAEMYSTAQLSCDRASMSILRYMEKTRSLSALLWAITDNVVMSRCVKCGKRIPQANVFLCHLCPECVETTVSRVE